MEFTLTPDDAANKVTLILAGDCRVDSAGELRDALARALLSHDRLELDVSQVHSLDISLLQLLLSTAQSAKAQGKTLIRAGELPEIVREAARVCGFCSLPELQELFPAQACWPARD